MSLSREKHCAPRSGGPCALRRGSPDPSLHPRLPLSTPSPTLSTLFSATAHLTVKHTIAPQVICVEADCAVKLPTWELEASEESGNAQQRLRQLSVGGERQQHQHGRRASVQNNPPAWGIDRIDSRTGTDDKYTYGDFDGEGVRVYILDTGVRLTHEEFAGRIDTGCARRSDPRPYSPHPHPARLTPASTPPRSLAHVQHLTHLEYTLCVTAHARLCAGTRLASSTTVGLTTPTTQTTATATAPTAPALRWARALASPRRRR